MEDLEDEAAAADAELEGGDGVSGVWAGDGAPLDVEADEEVAVAVMAAVEAENVGEPDVDVGGGGGEDCVDGVGVEGDVVEVMATVGKVVVDDADRGAWGCGVWG